MVSVIWSTLLVLDVGGRLEMDATKITKICDNWEQILLDEGSDNSCRPDVASATGITQTGQFVGGVGGPVLFGFVAKHAGIRPAWLVAGVVGAIGGNALVLATNRLHEA